MKLIARPSPTCANDGDVNLALAVMKCQHIFVMDYENSIMIAVLKNRGEVVTEIQGTKMEERLNRQCLLLSMRKFGVLQVKLVLYST